MPMSHNTTVLVKRLMLLHSIIYGRKIDIGELIFEQIHECPKRNRGNLLFPNLITALCKKNKVPEEPFEDFNKSNEGITKNKTADLPIIILKYKAGGSTYHASTSHIPPEVPPEVPTDVLPLATHVPPELEEGQGDTEEFLSSSSFSTSESSQASPFNFFPDQAFTPAPNQPKHSSIQSPVINSNMSLDQQEALQENDRSYTSSIFCDDNSSRLGIRESLSSQMTPNEGVQSSISAATQILSHPSDLSVRPVIPSRKADKLIEVIPSLPFEALQPSDFAKMPKEQLDVLYNKITAIFGGNAGIVEKQNVIRYLEMLSNNADATNILTNGPITLMLVKMLRQSKTSTLRVQLASMIGLLIRHSTFIEDDLANSGILGALTDGLRDRQERVRRFSMASLGKQESMRLTAESCLVRLARFSPQSIQSVVDRLSLKDIASTLIKGSLREQQISLNLLNLAMPGSHLFSNIGRYLLPLVEEKNLVPSLVSLIEQGSEVLRGKALVFVSLLCKNGKRWLQQFFCNARLLPTVDRLAKEKDNFIQQCLFLHVVASTISNLLDAITGDIQQMMGGRRQISALMSRSAPKNNTHLFPVILHLLGSMPFRNRVVTHQVFAAVGQSYPSCGDTISTLTILFIDQGRDDFQITLLRVLESIPESPVILECPNIFIRGILPSLAVLYNGNIDGNARFLCLKITFDVMVIFLNEPSLKDQLSEDLKSISNSHFLPLYPSLIEDEDPIPMYAQKLLVMLIEFGYIKFSDILDLKMVSKCFEFLLSDLTNANVNNVKLCLALASAPEMDSKLLSQLKVVRKIGNLLEFVYAKDMEDFIDPTLGLCRAFLLCSVGGRKRFVYTTEPALLGDITPEPSAQIDLQHCIRDIMDFGSNVRVLLELSASHEASIADIASECIIFLLKAIPREATTAFLTNLPKAGSILESRSKGISYLILRRILHAVGYSCRQYLAHAMILSISKPEITRIERIVSELKSSSTPGLANVAALVLPELQQLQRCVELLEAIVVY
ncbi:1-deoxy-D-xylulose 5-phosphate synthase family protein [Hibiscus syriacus]|uniref:1-deoxy-D-xylulose 5-phosphate synthase family protein n=1 Tax=Hibiscus syriacus TaxID=106335 RepID=A0A6A2ZA78_HIBSY|nr:1-deoxy-D-xylulose 5-phosphate synthase family protein [Hibiscus syriacus]